MSFPCRHPLRAGAALALLVVLGLVVREGLRAWRVRQYRHAAEEELARYNFEEARGPLAECLRLRPRDAGLRLLAARVARRGGFLDEAEDQLDAYRALAGKDTPEAALEYRLLRAQRGELPGLEEYLERCVAAGHPDGDLILEAMAFGVVEVYRLDHGMYLLDRLLRRQPDNVRALLQRGLLKQSAGQVEEALADYRRAVESHPGNNRAELRLADTLRKRKEHAEAAGHYERLRRRKPGDPPVLLGLARCYLHLGRRDDARRLLDELLAQHPEDGAALLERGKLTMEAGEPAEAEGFLRRAVAALPNDRDANYHLSLCLQGVGKAEEAATYLGRMRAIEEDLKRLLALYTDSLKYPNDPAPRLEAGRICERNGQPKEALRWFQGALQAGPDHRPTHQALGDLYERQGDYARAKHHHSLAGSAPR